ncbi:Helicase conserved C-terminal domain-containing protein [Selenomonas sp. GACV-9]|uniref:SNF2-related protein n=1 Tax=Selenomonas sp. GACV-9 TaxID=3158782 RepID=UPI0008E7A3E6|nr:Helicase conserved C-terminal domain-containing protein [Selenomonas ruminantium]
MFTDLTLSPFYTSEDDIDKNFLTPVLKEAKTYDRVSAYFTAGSLAAYAEGLEEFCGKEHSYRLIVSKDISEEDFEAMKRGYALRDSLRQEMLADLRRELDISAEKGLSNLAHLIAIGRMDIKIAYNKRGIFHDKFGILTDDAGNRIKFIGSNNETTAAMWQNHESFDVVCSWYDKDGFYGRGIDKCQRIFDAYWDGGYGSVIVRDVDDVVLQEIMRHDKGEMVREAALLMDNACILDVVDGRFLLHLNVEDRGEYLKTRGFMRRIKKYMDRDAEERTGKILFREGLSHIDCIAIDKLLADRIPKEGYTYRMTEVLKDFIREREIHIDERSTMGLDIKRRDERLLERFEEFAVIVNHRMERKLRERQMWDAFFMTTMVKSGNFSVPGSGKTSSVLGMYAFLQERAGMRRIVMVGPKNSFGSWIDEFQACFGDKQELCLFNLHDEEPRTKEENRRLLRYHFENYNLMLFNYESIGTYEEELKALVARSDTMLVFDEVHKVKGVNGKRAEVALSIASAARYVTVMTGTPIPNGYVDIYNMLHIMFPNEYRSFFGYQLSELKDPTEWEKEEINRKLKPFYCRTTKEQLAVPPVSPDIYREVTASEAESRLFYILREAYGKGNSLLFFLRVLQLESDPAMLMDNISMSDYEDVMEYDAKDIDDIDFKDFSDEVPKLVDACSGLSSKMRCCIEQLVSLVAAGKTAVCWCVFRRTIRKVQQELQRRGIRARFIDGSVEQADRLVIIDDFRKGGFDVLITNPHTLAESVSLHSVCHDAVYMEYTYNLVHLLQSKDRIHRLGLPDGQYTQYYYMMVDFDFQGKPVSVDKAVYERLQEKEQLMLTAIDDGVLEDTTTSDEDLEMIFAEVFGDDWGRS